MLRSFLLVSCLMVVGLSGVDAINNGLGLVPQMGYNTWYDLMCTSAMNETTVLQTAQALVTTGLAQLGYTYVNLDDCWSGGRLGNGIQFSDNVTFPSGIQNLAMEVHNLGLKFGLYTDRGTQTCAGRPGAFGWETIDANSYAEWGVDYLKEDSCNASQDHDIAFGEYATMRDALNATNRPIFFSLCGWYEWYGARCGSLGNSCRIGQDDTTWEGILANIDTMNTWNLYQYGGPGSIMDPCMLLSAAGDGTRAVTEMQTRTQFNQWAIMASPLLISGSILHMSQSDFDTYSNEEVIAVNQDPQVIQGRMVQSMPANTNLTNGAAQIWARQLSTPNTFAVHFLNAASQAYTLTCNLACFQTIFNSANPIPNGFAVSVRDLWKHADVAVLVNPDFTPGPLAANGGSAMFTFTLISLNAADKKQGEKIALE